MAKAKESYEEWKQRKEQEGTLPASTTQRSATSAGSSYKPKESYEEWKARKEGKTSSNNLITSFLTDSRAYLSSAQKEYDSLNYQTGKSTYVKRMTDAERLKARGRQIQQYIDRSGNSSEYADLKKYLEEFEKSADNVLDAFRSSADFYGQFESEEKYNEYAAYQKDREEKSVFDLDAGQKEIAAMEQELAELKRQKSTDDSVKSMQNLYAGSTYAAAQGDIKSDRDLKIREMEQQISSKKQYLNDAKRIQDGATLASVSGNDDFDAYNGYVSTKNDSVRGQFGMGYDDLTYEYINGDDNGMRQSIINKAVSYDADTEKFFSYDHMTPDQIAIYNYHYAKDGKEAAEKYLNSIQETLNDKAATERFEKMKDRTALELVFGLEAGLDQFQSGVKNLFNTNDDYIPQTATQMASGMVREDLADNGFNFWYNFKDKEWQGTILGNSVGQVAYDAITTSANMAPSILASIAADFILPGSGAYVGSGLMGGSAAGNAYQEALNEGYDKNQARGYGLLVGASEIAMENVLGGISAFGGNALGKYMTQNVGAADTALKMIGKRLGASAISEFSEEYLQEVLTPVFQNIMLDTNNEVKLFSAEALYSGILGALTAGIMEGPTVIGGEVRTNRTGKQLKAAGVSAQRLADIGKTFAADTVAYQLAGKVDENTNAYTMGRLFYEIGATLTEQNVSDITEALVAKGWDRDVAAKNAKVMAAVVDGEKLSDKQVAIIEANDSLAEAMRTTIVDPNATWFQRNKGYNDIAMTLAQKMTAPKSTKTKQSLPGQDNAVASEQADTAKEVGAEETPAPSRAQGITRVQGEDVIVKLEDGSEVSIKDADLDPYDGVMIETIARIDGISAEDANYIFNALKAAPGARADFTARGAEEAYRYGYYGFDDKYIEEHGVFANSLTETQRKTIYEKGRLARQTKVANKNATAAKKNATTEKTSTAGRVHFDGDRTKLNSRRKASLSALDKIAEITGLQVYVFTSYLKGNKRVYLDENGVEKAAPNGWYDPSDNSIHIDLNAGANGEGTMLFTLAHELTHHIRKWSPAKFKILADFLMQEYGKKGVNVDALVREQMAKAKRNGRTISYDTAYEEVVADSMETMLSDGAVLEKLEKLKQKDESLWQKIKDFISELAAKIRNVYEGMTPDSVEGRYVAEMVDSIERLQELFTEGLVEASENFQSAEKNTTDDGGVKYSERYLAADTNSEILAMVNRVSKGEFKANEKVYLGTVSDTIADQINKLTGINVDGFKIAIEARQIDHILRGHGANGDSDQSMADPGDIAKMEYALGNPDDIRKAGKTQAYTYMRNGRNRTADTVLYEKEIGEKSYYVVQAVPDTKAKTLYIVTAFIGQKGYKKEAPQLINAKNLDATAKTGSANASKDIVRNNGEKVNSGSVESMDITMDEKTESIAPAVLFSERTWTESDYVQEREKAAEEISKAIGVSKKKAKAYIDSVNSIAKMIAEDRVRLDYFSSPNRSSFVSNVEYGGSFDFSTLCKKRRLLTGTFTAIQKALPNTALTANEILDIRNRMKDKGLEVSCGLCYVEGSRANMGQFAKEFLKLYKQYYPDAWQPNMADVNTPDGIEWVRINHPECYEQYEYFWNHYGTLKEGDKNLFASQQKPKLYQLHTEYKGEILQKFQDDDNVEEKNLNGGIRLQSFSDFEIVHLIDTMQIIMDMSRVGLAGQAYTKVPDFAWALGDTGLKINLSLIAKGVDENGKLIFDDVEGMPIADAMKLRERYSKNVGTILVAFNDAQLLAAMADDRVDFIIPFHRSQWKKSQYEAMGLPAKTKDYTYMQNEKFIKPQYHEYRGRMVKDKATNYMPNEYWDFSKSGKENAVAYLEMCARNNKRPKFYKLLQNNGDGSYSLKADGSTDGYWKLLIDFKMYDNSGKGSPQMPVKPDFNMDEATRMLNEYSGGHSSFPVAQGIVDDFVKEYKDSHKGVKYSDRDTDSVSNRSLLANAFEGVAQNDIERNKIQEYKEKIDQINSQEQKLAKINQQIKELSFAKGPRDTAKIKELREEAIKITNRINIFDKQLIRLEASAPLQAVLDREKKKAYKRAEQKGKEALTEYKKKAMAEQQEIAERYRESKKKAMSKAKESRDKREAREKLQKLVLDTAKWISHPAKTAVKCPDILKQPYADFLNSIDMSSERLAKGGDPTKNDLRLANTMGSLATALEKVMASQDPTQDTAAVLDAGYLDLPANFVQKLRDMTEDVKAMMIEGEYVVNTMTAEEVRKLSQMIRTLNHAIKEVSTLYANLRFANVEMLGDESMAFMDAIGEIQKTSGMKDFVQWENALPYYAFKRFGKGGESIFEGLMDAQDKLAFLAQNIFNFQEKTWKGDEAKKWSEDTHTIDLPDGEQLTLTTADAMSIYCLSRRQQGLQHLMGGGVRVMGIKKDSQKAKDSRSTLTIKDIDAIISSLTDRQKKVAEAIQEFMSTTCSEWGNEISMKRFLTKEFNEKFYFPIESNDENLPTKDPSAQQSDLFRLLNISATKAIDPRANNEVIIRNIFDVFTGHASDMARLNAFGLPLLDYMKWLNYREKTVNEEGQIKVRGVRKYMETAYGNAAKSYVLNLIKDVNGRPSDNGDPSILMKWMRSAKTASVGSSFRVATLQLTSYPRAALVLSPKSLVLGLSKVPNIEKAKKYCGIALWKSFGFYDTNISRSIEEQMKGVKDVKQKLIEFSLKGAEWGDAITWGAMWNACEYEVASTKKYKVGSEEFYEAVGKKLREVVYRTQVVDSTLTRSQIMRSKRGMTQEAAAFMSEPTLSANILMDAGMEFNLEKRRTNAKTAWNKTGKYVTNALAVYSIGQLTAALLEGLWDAWRDDEDEKFGDKFISAFTENLVMDLVPFNKIPIVSDVFEAGLAMIGVGFYSSDKMSTTWLTQAVSAADAWRDVIGGNSSVTTYNALYKSVRALSSFYGVSASGVMREGVDMWNNTAGAYDLTLKVLNYDRSKAELGSLLLDAIIEGNDRQADSLRAEFEDEDAYQSALRSAIKEQYLAGEIDTSTAQEYLALYGGKDDSKAYWLTEEWMYESGSDEEFGKYNKFFDAVKTGKNLKAVIKEYTSNGVKPETLAGQITEHFKPEYVEMTRSEKASIKGYLLNAFEQCGVKREDAAKKLQHWEFLSDNPGSDLNQSQAENYQEFAKPAGISVKQFADYCRKTKGISKKEDLMNIIDSLPINSAQKDALYYSEGWAKSKLNEAPWH